jgi:hypothetical protein
MEIMCVFMNWRAFEFLQAKGDAIGIDWSQPTLSVGHYVCIATLFVLTLCLIRTRLLQHARRLYPLQISKQDKVEWAYSAASSQGDANADGETDVDDASNASPPPAASWSVIIPKEIALETGLEKKVGFQGRPDPASGYYCLYKEGRRVTAAGATERADADAKTMRPDSKKAS